MVDFDEAFLQAFGLHQAGYLGEACDIYKRLMETYPDHAQLLFLLGSADLQLRRYSEAERRLRQSIAIDRGNANAWSNLGVAIREVGDPSLSVKAYAMALQLNPQYSDAWYNRSIALQEAGLIKDAISGYRRALNGSPKNVQAYNNLGNLLNQNGRQAEAIKAYNKAIILSPQYADAYNNLGNSQREMALLSGAILSYERAVIINPGYAEAINNQGVVLRQIGEREQALICYDKALEVKPDYVEALNNKGTLLKEIGLSQESLLAYKRAISIRPSYPEGFSNLGMFFNGIRDFEEALIYYRRATFVRPNFPEALNNSGITYKGMLCYQKASLNYRSALVLFPDYCDALCNLANVLMETLALQEALINYKRAIAINPGSADVWWNMSLVILLRGDYLNGWALYEWRLKKADFKDAYCRFPDREWREISGLKGLRLLVYSEQGFGDIIQFSRYLNLLSPLVSELIFEVPAPIGPLLSTLQSKVHVVTKGSRLPEFDVCCPLMSLPFVFGTEMDSIPQEVPYFFSDPKKVRKWAVILGARKKFRVGLVWSGSLTHKRDLSRSIPLREILPLLKVPVEWHSLQLEYREADLAWLQSDSEIRQHQDKLKDFSDTAALISCMDLVVTVDSSVAHLAGSMGKPVWILVPYSPDFRWLLNRMDSPWYPTARLYRQDEIGNWQGVLRRIADDLLTLLEDLSSGESV